MGEEADADWEAGLEEWAREEYEAYFQKKIDEAVIGGPPRKRRQTALRTRGRGFETVELDEDGNAIEPVRCICGVYAIMHRPACPFYCMVT